MARAAGITESKQGLQQPAIRVLEIGRGFDVAALCGQLFAAAGAAVKVMGSPAITALRSSGPPVRDGSGYLFHLLHDGKENIPKSLVDAQIIPLIDWADVILVDIGGPDTPALLADAAVFGAKWPKKILCTCSLYGAKSARPGWIGNELVAEAAGALMICNGYAERPPVASGLPYALHTAALFAFNAVMTALWERHQSGRGQTIDLAIVDCIVSILGNFLPSYFLSGKSPKRIGNRHTIAAPWNLYPASDGSVVICTGTGGTGWWAKVTSVIGRPDLADDARYKTEADRVRNVDAVDAIVAGWTSRHSMASIVEQMTVQGIPVSEISTVEAVLNDPHYRDLREMIIPGSQHSVKGLVLPTVGSPIKVAPWKTPAVEADPWRTAKQPSGGQSLRHGIGALSGIRILEFASRTSAPLAGRLFADFGAEVVKIEPTKGDALRGAGQRMGDSSYLFHINNAGKDSVVIEPSDPDGRNLILKLVAQADVFIENLAPGSLKKMGLGYVELKAANPNIIYCSVNGFGEKSNYGGKRALDTVVQAACGLMHMTGYPDHFPVKLGISAIDLTTATAVMAAVLAALHERRASGQGMRIDMAMADVGIWMTQRVWPEILCEGRHPMRLGNRSADASPHNIYPTRDSRLVAIAVETEAQWRAFVDLVAIPELAAPRFLEPAQRVAHSDLIENLMSQWTLQHDADWIAEACQRNGIAASLVRDLAEVVSDPELIARRMILEVDHVSAGRIRVLGNPLALSRTPPVITRAAPLLGEHTRQVLTEWLALSKDEVDALIATRTIVDANQNSKTNIVSDALST